MMTVLYDDAELVSTLQKNTNTGFRLLMEKYMKAVYWHIRRLVVSHDEANDTTQKTFVRIFRLFDQFDGDCSLAAWVLRTATNTIEGLSACQRYGRSLLGGNGPIRLHTDDYIDFSDRKAVILQRATLGLPIRQQMAFNLRHYNELSYEEIATVTGTTPEDAEADCRTAVRALAGSEAKDIDIESVKNSMPYTTPVNYFDKMQADVWREVMSDPLRHLRRRSTQQKLVVGATAAAACLFLLLHTNSFSSDHAEELLKVEQSFARLSHDDQVYMIDMYREALTADE